MSECMEISKINAKDEWHLIGRYNKNSHKKKT